MNNLFARFDREARLMIMAAAAVVALVGAVWFAFLAAQNRETTPLRPSVAENAPLPPLAAPKAEEPAPEQAAPARGGRGEIETTLARTPEIGRFFGRLRDTLPGEYQNIMAKLAARKDIDGANPDLLLSEGVKLLRQSRGALAAKASDEKLANIFQKQLVVMEALQKQDARACVDFLYGGASADLFRLSAANRDAVSDLALAGLDAILSGEQKKIVRSAPTDADFQQLEGGLQRAGLAKPEIEALLDGKTPSPPLPDARMCKAGVVYLETLSVMPPEARLRIYALAIDMMART
ncbi:MAG: hypothetical protein KGL46_05715 [Hyphomicrobiales bacterium]|nr:hypothetical protein [Hyphomicrobiales bacterium]